MSNKITHLSGLGLKNTNTEDPDVNGEIKYVSGTGFRFYQEGTVYTFQTTGGGGSGSTAYDDIGDPDANTTIAFAGFTNQWNTTLDNGVFFTILSQDADLGDDTTLLRLAFTDDGDANGLFLECADNANADIKFTIGANGATTIAGVASTDILTITAGDIQITAGDIDVDLGIITVDNTADEGNKIARNNATGTAPVLEVEQTHATGGVAFLVDQNATGDVNALEVTNAGTGFAFTTTGGAAGSQGFEFIAAASATGNGLLLNGTTGDAAWIGAANTGFAQIQSDGVLAQTTATMLLVAFSGTSASGGLGTCARFVDTSTSGGGTEYAVYISSTNSEALHVDTGTVQFDEAVTIGVSDTGADLKVFGATASKFMVWDESADDLILADAVALQLGGDESTADGFKIEFDGTSILAIDALTANDGIVVGGVASTDFTLTGANGDVVFDASADLLTVGGNAALSSALTITAGDFVMSDGVLTPAVSAGVTADTGSSQGDEPITNSIVEISICANAGDAVTLPTASAGRTVIITNHGGEAADVFPATGDAINEGSANAATSIAVNETLLCIAYDSTNWEVVQLARNS